MAEIVEERYDETSVYFKVEMRYRTVLVEAKPDVSEMDGVQYAFAYDDTDNGVTAEHAKVAYGLARARMLEILDERHRSEQQRQCRSIRWRYKRADNEPPDIPRL